MVTGKRGYDRVRNTEIALMDFKYVLLLCFVVVVVTKDRRFVFSLSVIVTYCMLSPRFSPFFARITHCQHPFQHAQAQVL